MSYWSWEVQLVFSNYNKINYKKVITISCSWFMVFRFVSIHKEKASIENLTSLFNNSLWLVPLCLIAFRQNLSFSWFTNFKLTLWYLKKVLIDTQPNPMCRKIWNTLVADPPDRRVAMQRRKLPAGIFEFGNNGWLYQVFSCWHLGFVQVVFTMTSVPISLVWTSGLSALHVKQNLNNSSNFVKKTMCLGSVLMFVSLSGNL